MEKVLSTFGCKISKVRTLFVFSAEQRFAAALGCRLDVIDIAFVKPHQTTWIEAELHGVHF
jgi:hypothetical protein